MGLLGFFNSSFQDDSKRPLVNKWLDTLEPPDQQSLSELEQDFDDFKEYHHLSSPPSPPASANDPVHMSPPVQRHYDWSQVAVSAWKDPFHAHGNTPYESSWQDTREKSYTGYGYERALAYQIYDRESSSDEDEEEEEDDDDDIVAESSGTQVSSAVEAAPPPPPPPLDEPTASIEALPPPPLPSATEPLEQEVENDEPKTSEIAPPLQAPIASTVEDEAPLPDPPPLVEEVPKSSEPVDEERSEVLPPANSPPETNESASFQPPLSSFEGAEAVPEVAPVLEESIEPADLPDLAPTTTEDDLPAPPPPLPLPIEALAEQSPAELVDDPIVDLPPPPPVPVSLPEAEALPPPPEPTFAPGDVDLLTPPMPSSNDDMPPPPLPHPSDDDPAESNPEAPPSPSATRSVMFDPSVQDPKGGKLSKKDRRSVKARTKPVDEKKLAKEEEKKAKQEIRKQKDRAKADAAGEKQKITKDDKGRITVVTEKKAMEKKQVPKEEEKRDAPRELRRKASVKELSLRDMRKKKEADLKKAKADKKKKESEERAAKTPTKSALKKSFQVASTGSDEGDNSGEPVGEESEIVAETAEEIAPVEAVESDVIGEQPISHEEDMPATAAPGSQLGNPDDAERASDMQQDLEAGAIEKVDDTSQPPLPEDDAPVNDVQPADDPLETSAASAPDVALDASEAVSAVPVILENLDIDKSPVEEPSSMIAIEHEMPEAEPCEPTELAAPGNILEESSAGENEECSGQTDAPDEVAEVCEANNDSPAPIELSTLKCSQPEQEEIPSETAPTTNETATEHLEIESDPVVSEIPLQETIVLEEISDSPVSADNEVPDPILSHQGEPEHREVELELAATVPDGSGDPQGHSPCIEETNSLVHGDVSGELHPEGDGETLAQAVAFDEVEEVSEDSDAQEPIPAATEDVEEVSENSDAQEPITASTGDVQEASEDSHAQETIQAPREDVEDALENLDPEETVRVPTEDREEVSENPDALDAIHVPTEDMEPESAEDSVPSQPSLLPEESSIIPEPIEATASDIPAEDGQIPDEIGEASEIAAPVGYEESPVHDQSLLASESLEEAEAEVEQAPQELFASDQEMGDIPEPGDPLPESAGFAGEQDGRSSQDEAEEDASGTSANADSSCTPIAPSVSDFAHENEPEVFESKADDCDPLQDPTMPLNFDTVADDFGDVDFEEEAVQVDVIHDEAEVVVTETESLNDLATEVIEHESFNIGVRDAGDDMADQDVAPEDHANVIADLDEPTDGMTEESEDAPELPVLSNGLDSHIDEGSSVPPALPPPPLPPAEDLPGEIDQDQAHEVNADEAKEHSEPVSAGEDLGELVPDPEIPSNDAPVSEESDASDHVTETVSDPALATGQDDSETGPETVHIDGVVDSGHQEDGHEDLKDEVLEQNDDRQDITEESVDNTPEDELPEHAHPAGDLVDHVIDTGAAEPVDVGDQAAAMDSNHGEENLPTDQEQNIDDDPPQGDENIEDDPPERDDDAQDQPLERSAGGEENGNDDDENADDPALQADERESEAVNEAEAVDEIQADDDVSAPGPEELSSQLAEQEQEEDAEPPVELESQDPSPVVIADEPVVDHATQPEETKSAVLEDIDGGVVDEDNAAEVSETASDSGPAGHGDEYHEEPADQPGELLDQPEAGKDETQAVSSVGDDQGDDYSEPAPAEVSQDQSGMVEEIQPAQATSAEDEPVPSESPPEHGLAVPEAPMAPILEIVDIEDIQDTGGDEMICDEGGSVSQKAMESADLSSNPTPAADHEAEADAKATNDVSTLADQVSSEPIEEAKDLVPAELPSIPSPDINGGERRKRRHSHAPRPERRMSTSMSSPKKRDSMDAAAATSGGGIFGFLRGSAVAPDRKREPERPRTGTSSQNRPRTADEDEERRKRHEARRAERKRREEGGEEEEVGAKKKISEPRREERKKRSDAKRSDEKRSDERRSDEKRSDERRSDEKRSSQRDIVEPPAPDQLKSRSLEAPKSAEKSRRHHKTREPPVTPPDLDSGSPAPKPANEEEERRRRRRTAREAARRAAEAEDEAKAASAEKAKLDALNAKEAAEATPPPARLRESGRRHTDRAVRKTEAPPSPKPGLLRSLTSAGNSGGARTSFFGSLLSSPRKESPIPTRSSPVKREEKVKRHTRTASEEERHARRRVERRRGETLRDLEGKDAPRLKPADGDLPPPPPPPPPFMVMPDVADFLPDPAPPGAMPADLNDLPPPPLPMPPPAEDSAPPSKDRPRSKRVESDRHHRRTRESTTRPRTTRIESDRPRASRKVSVVVAEGDRSPPKQSSGASTPRKTRPAPGGQAGVGFFGGLKKVLAM